jgi:hypothetical protein
VSGSPPKRFCTILAPARTSSTSAAYLFRFAVNSSVAKSATLRVNLISSSEILPVYSMGVVIPSQVKFSTNESASPSTLPSCISLSPFCEIAFPVSLDPAALSWYV